MAGEVSQLSFAESPPRHVSEDEGRPSPDFAYEVDNRPCSTASTAEDAELAAIIPRPNRGLSNLTRAEASACHDSKDGAPGLVKCSQTSEAAAPQVDFTRSSNKPVSSLSYLAHRRSAPTLRHPHPVAKKFTLAEVSGNAISQRCIKRSSSFVRLSTTGEGNAKVLTKDNSSPSPSRPIQSFHQNVSNGNGVNRPPTNMAHTSSNPAMKPLQRSSSGRSRDSRAWEFWCDKDTRGELGEKAEKNASGSAAAAIGLLRSASGRTVLGAIPAKRNTALSRQSASLKRSKLDPVRSSLQRSSTSFGRLQGKPLADENLISKPNPKLKHTESAISNYVPGNDSDKENWSPDGNLSTNRPSEKSPAYVHQYVSGYKQETAAARSHERPRQPAVDEVRSRRSLISNTENNDPEADPELAAFMRGGGKSNGTSEEEDLDCIQGLLSLSQGNWR